MPQKNRRPWLRWLIGIPVVSLMVLGSLVLFLRLNTLQDAITTVVNRFMAPGGKVTRLGGVWPFQISMEKLVLSDGDGPWLEVSGGQWHWSLEGVLAGRLETRRLHIETMVVHRLPKGNPAATDTPQSWSPHSFSLWPWIIQNLEVKSLVLGHDLVDKGATFHVNGALGLENDQLSGKIHIQLPSLSPWSRLAGVPLTGPLALTATLSGTSKSPQVSIHTQSSAMTIADTTVEGIQWQLQVDPPLEAGLGWNFLLNGTANQAKLGHQPEDFRLDHPKVSANWVLETHSIWRIKQFHLADTHGQGINLQGSWNQSSASGRMELQTDPFDLSRHPATRNLGLSGRLALSGVADVTQGGKMVDFRLRTQGEKLTGWNEFLSPLLGDHPKLLVNGILNPERHVVFRVAHLEGTDLEGSCHGDVDLEQETFSSSLRAKVRRLAPLSQATGHAVAGQLQFSARAGGPWRDPWVDLKVHGDPMQFPNIDIESIDGILRGKNLISAPQGDVHAHVRAKRETVTLESKFQWLRDKDTLQLDHLLVTGPKSKISGSVKTSLSSFLPQGRLEATIESLSALKPWHGQEWEGRVEARLDLAKGHGKGTLRTTGLQGPFGMLRHGQVTWDAPIDVREGGVTAHVLAHDLESSGMVFNTIDLHGNGDQKKFLFSLAGKGHATNPFSWNTQGEWMAVGDGVRIRFAHLDGLLDREPLHLQKPWVITAAAGQLSVDPLDVTLAKTRLRATYEQKKGRVDGQFRLQGQLSALSQFTAVPVGGDVALTGTMTGSAAAPKLVVTIRATQLKHQNSHLAQLPPLNLSGQLRVEKGKNAQIALTVAGLGTSPAEVTGTVPMLLSAAPLTARFMPHDPLNGSMKGMVNLADLALWLGLGEDHRIRGEVQALFATTGSLEKPRLDGTLAMDKGDYENADLGMAFRDIQLRAKANGDVVIIEQMTASDGGTGQIHAQGQWILDPAKQFPFHVTMALDQAKVLHREDANANLSGTLSLDGTTTAMDLQGALTVNNAYYQLKDFHGRTPLRVVDFRETGQTMPAQQTSSGDRDSHLDVRIAFPGQTFVRGRGLDSQWQGSLHVQGSFEEPRIAGTLEVRRGYLNFLNRRYESNQGIIRFSGQFPPNPTIDVEAVTKSHDLEVTANLEGSVTSPRLRFSSVPSMPEDEVLAYLLFGRSVDTITPAQAIKLASTVQSLRSGKMGIVEEIGQSLGVDQLDFKGDSMQTGTINAGKRLSDKMYLEVQKGMKADSDRINLEYDLTPEISLQTGVDAKSNTDIGIMWNRDY
ncbi:MAG: translocation/assembly module TamB domain-containing protein [Nitrospirae bacterium]|nr:translocation/assembly module TamB domain-containing protein [Magnetococcales bacterium]